MNRRIILSAGGVTAGLLTTTFLPVTVAFADNGVGAAGDIGSTAVPVGLASYVTAAGNTAALGDTGTLGDTGGLGSGLNASPAPLGELGALAPGTGTPEITPADTTPGASDDFTIGDITFSPVQADGSEGFTPLSPLFGAAPLFQVATGDQSFDISTGTGDGATDLGNVTASENVTNLFGGIHSTEFTITDVDPASGASDTDLPAVGTVYDVMNFGNGFQNIYTAVPGVDGADGSITDTLVTPFGDFNIPTDFDATGLLDPGDAFTGLSSLGADAAGSAADAAAGAADTAGGAADAAGSAVDAADVASLFDPSSLLGI